MHFDDAMISNLRSASELLEVDEAQYLSMQESLAQAFVGRETSLEDIIYDFDVSTVRLEAMMVCKLMPSMDRMRIYEDMSLAEPDPELKQWAGILFRQEHLIETAKTFNAKKDA